MPEGFSLRDLWLILPEIVLAVGALVVLMADLFVGRDRQKVLVWLGLVVVGATAVALVPFIGVTETASRGLVAIDPFALFFRVLFLLAAAFTLLMSRSFLEVEGMRAGEYVFLVLAATLGMMFMATGIDLVTLVVGLETMAISFYVLAGFIKPNRRSNEAAVKYFVLGAFSLGILVYGMSLLYGLSGTTRLREMAPALEAARLASPAWTPGLILGMILVAAGMAFKVAAVPFHMWAPDVYEGAPTPITAFLSVGSKAASFAMLIRIFMEGLAFMAVDWQVLFYGLAVVSMTVGNIAALTQTNTKRLLAYSSIAHAGYLLIGLVAATPRGVTSMLVYLFVYAFMQMGAFSVVVLLRRREVIGDELKDLSGLYFRSPAAAVAMLVFMLSLGGIPPTAGFMGKLWIFSAAIEAGFVWLAVIGVLNSAISLYYYIRVVVFMWMKGDTQPVPISLAPAMVVALVVAVAGTVVFGLYPAALFELAEASAASLAEVAPAVTLAR